MDMVTTSIRPDYAGAIAYALDRLRTELPAHLYYHNALHTEEDVLPAVVRLARLSNVAEPDLHLLEVGAAFHDLGQIRTNLGHELIGMEIIAWVLPEFGFSPQEIARVSGMILATRLPQTPLNDEQALLCDADLDSLGREDFFATSKALWQERAAWPGHSVANLAGKSASLSPDTPVFHPCSPSLASGRQAKKHRDA